LIFYQGAYLFFSQRYCPRKVRGMVFNFSETAWVSSGFLLRGLSFDSAANAEMPDRINAAATFGT